MAEQQKKTYPMLPISHWWALRKKFKQSIPGIVTDSYLATVLSMEVNSARANVLPFLKTLGIIDDDGKTLDRARQWRDDEHYADVCKAIVKEVYPKELLEAVTGAEQRTQAERWFANKTGAGTAAVKRMAVLYSMLLEADASKQPEQERGESTRKPSQGRATKKTEKETRPTAAPPPSAPIQHPGGDNKAPTLPQTPGININLQIHISADSSSDQIDQIFASMAKHIYRHG